MTDAVKRQIAEAKKKLATNTKPATGTQPVAGRSSYSRKKIMSQGSDAPKPATGEEESGQEEETEVPSTEPLTPQPRYYLSTATTPEGLLMARLVGFTGEQWKDLTQHLAAAGFRPY